MGGRGREGGSRAKPGNQLVLYIGMESISLEIYRYARKNTKESN